MSVTYSYTICNNDCSSPGWIRLKDTDHEPISATVHATFSGPIHRAAVDLTAIQYLCGERWRKSLDMYTAQQRVAELAGVLKLAWCTKMPAPTGSLEDAVSGRCELKGYRAKAGDASQRRYFTDVRFVLEAHTEEGEAFLHWFDAQVAGHILANEL